MLIAVVEGVVAVVVVVVSVDEVVVAVVVVVVAVDEVVVVVVEVVVVLTVSVQIAVSFFSPQKVSIHKFSRLSHFRSRTCFFLSLHFPH